LLRGDAAPAIPACRPPGPRLRRSPRRESVTRLSVWYRSSLTKFSQTRTQHVRYWPPPAKADCPTSRHDDVRTAFPPRTPRLRPLRRDAAPPQRGAARADGPARRRGARGAGVRQRVRRRRDDRRRPARRPVAPARPAARAGRARGGRRTACRRRGRLSPGPAMRDLGPGPVAVRIPVRGTGARFLERRVYRVARNFAAHAREMGATPADPAARGTPVFFLKPADAVVVDGIVPYPPGTRELHHEVELVVALGSDAPAGMLAVDEAPALVFGYGV